MLTVYEYANPDQVAANSTLQVELDFDHRKRSRFRATTHCGKTVGFFLPRGNVLHCGDLLKAESGELIQVASAIEAVSTVTADNPLALLKAAYHLGNRHVPLQIDYQTDPHSNPNIHWLRYLQDYVLDDMVIQLGANINHETVAFQPESGAYGGDGNIAGGHSHGDDHNNQHGHNHTP